MDNGNIPPDRERYDLSNLLTHFLFERMSESVGQHNYTVEQKFVVWLWTEFVCV